MKVIESLKTFWFEKFVLPNILCCVCVLYALYKGYINKILKSAFTFMIAIYFL